MSEAFLEQEKGTETKNAKDEEKIETIGDTITNIGVKETENEDGVKNQFENIPVEMSPKEIEKDDIGLEKETKTEGILTEHNQQEQPDIDVENKDASRASNQKEEWIDILGSGAIMKKIIQEGKSDIKPQKSEKCTINYTCSLEDGTIIDSTNDFEFYLSESDVSSVLINY